MKINKCDICGKTVGEYELRSLYEKIQQEYIKDICEECNKELTEANYKIKEALDNVRVGWIQKVINKMVGRNKEDRSVSV